MKFKGRKELKRAKKRKIQMTDFVEVRLMSSRGGEQNYRLLVSPKFYDKNEGKLRRNGG